MGLESASHIDELVTTNPVGATDPKSQGDDHIRMIKDVLKTDFPDVDQATSNIFATATAPPLAIGGTVWFDTTANLLKIRDEGDTAWITLAVSITADNTVDIDGGAIDGTPIGGTTPAAIDCTTMDATGNSTVGGTLGVTGNINPTALVDGRDVAADGTKLDGIEALAEVNIALASQAEAEAGVENTKTMTALRTDQALENRIGSGGILQADIGAGQVGQAELKTTTGVLTETVGPTRQVRPGGDYAFLGLDLQTSSNDAQTELLTTASGAITSSYVAYIVLTSNIGGSHNYRERYVQASPPYDMGDGTVHSFIFGLVNNSTGMIESIYHAPEPPWANNGPTDIRADRVDPITGKRFKKVSNLGTDMRKLMEPDFLQEEEIELTPGLKNYDMGLLPHPFIGNDLTGKTVVLLDPMSNVVERLEGVKNAGGDAHEFVFGDYLKIGNEELGRGRPPEVMSVSVKMK